MLNCAVIMGRLTADPELRQTPSGVSVTRFTVAVDRSFVKAGEERKADFINVVAWRQTAEFVTRYFRKGSSICVVGSLQNRSWEDQQGQKRYATDIVADEVQFVDSRSEGPAAGGAQSGYTPDAYSAPSFASAPSAPNFEEVASDDDLPF